MSIVLRPDQSNPIKSIFQDFNDLEINDILCGNVVGIQNYGVFVEISPGITGLIHITELSWLPNFVRPQDFMVIGDKVEVIILSIDREKRIISLSSKKVRIDPWIKIDEKYSIGSQYKVKVKSFIKIGIIAELEEGLVGLVHKSDISWNSKSQHSPQNYFNIGDALDVIVLEIDILRRSISLGYKQLLENPWCQSELEFIEGSTHLGVIVGMKQKSGIVRFPNGIEGICPEKHLIKQDNSIAQIGENLSFIVLELNISANKLIVSHSHFINEPKKSEFENISKVNENKIYRLGKYLKIKLKNRFF
jgi:small subunit ribosomal protein S1